MRWMKWIGILCVVALVLPGCTVGGTPAASSPGSDGTASDAAPKLDPALVGKWSSPVEQIEFRSDGTGVGKSAGGTFKWSVPSAGILEMSVGPITSRREYEIEGDTMQVRNPGASTWETYPLHRQD